METADESATGSVFLFSGVKAAGGSSSGRGRLIRRRVCLDLPPCGNDDLVTKVLVVATAPIAPEEISSPIENRFGEGAEFMVIPLWVARPGERSAGVDPGRRNARMADPAGLIDEARRRYGADEIVVVTRTSDEASWLGTGAVESARAGLNAPLTHLLVA